MEEKKQPKKYQRREFIKTTGKAGIGVAVGGLVGYATGRTYKTGRDAYRENVKPYVEKGKEIIDKTEEKKEDVKDWWYKNFNKEEYVKRKQEEAESERQKIEPEKISRRGFFSKYFHLFNEHPVVTGTITGAALGGLVKSLRLYPQYLEKKKVAKLRDEHIDYGDRIRILEEYKENLEKASKGKDQKIIGLENELNKIYEKLNLSEKDSPGLEGKIKEVNLETPISMIVSGIFLIASFFLLNGISYTGFLTLSASSIKPSNFLDIIVLFTSFALIIIGIIKLRKIEKSIKPQKKIKKNK